MTEDEMVGWHHQLHGHEFEQGPGAGDGQESLVCSTVHLVAKSRTQLSDRTELNNNYGVIPGGESHMVQTYAYHIHG